MIDDANEAAEALAASSLAAELKRHGFSSSSMRQSAKRLTTLRTRIELAKARLTTALADLHKEGEHFAKRWSKYCNLVRGLTSDVALRNEHGVSTPGRRKTSSLHRGPRLAKTTGQTLPTNDVRPPSATGPARTGTDGGE
jgi:hypothetical protein